VIGRGGSRDTLGILQVPQVAVETSYPVTRRLSEVYHRLQTQENVRHVAQPSDSLLVRPIPFDCPNDGDITIPATPIVPCASATSTLGFSVHCAACTLHGR